MNSNYENFCKSQLQINPKIKKWEIHDKWLDQRFQQEDEQINPATQTTSPLQPVKNYREDEEECPEAADLKNHITQISTKVPTLGLNLSCVGKKNGSVDGRVWYVFSKETEQTPTGPQAKRFGPYGTKELKTMKDDLTTLGPDGIINYFSTKKQQPNTQP